MKNFHQQTYKSINHEKTIFGWVKVAIHHRAVVVRGHLLGDCVSVQIHTADISWGHVKVKVS